MQVARELIAAVTVPLAVPITPRATRASLECPLPEESPNSERRQEIKERKALLSHLLADGNVKFLRIYHKK